MQALADSGVRGQTARKSPIIGGPGEKPPPLRCASGHSTRLFEISICGKCERSTRRTGGRQRAAEGFATQARRKDPAQLLVTQLRSYPSSAGYRDHRDTPTGWPVANWRSAPVDSGGAAGTARCGRATSACTKAQEILVYAALVRLQPQPARRSSGHDLATPTASSRRWTIRAPS